MSVCTRVRTHMCVCVCNLLKALCNYVSPLKSQIHSFTQLTHTFGYQLQSPLYLTSTEKFCHDILYGYTQYLRNLIKSRHNK